jgi:2-polyprenyl-6-methoxyphenol hydroxylase-like FAD-dependent oxidoreductase
MNSMRTTCCVVGGGPAGVVLGFLMARAGVETLILEKHKDFLRDFRGDTVHPSTLDVISELGLLEDFLKLPHQKVGKLRGQINGRQITVADFAHTPTRCHFIVLMPQWDFLNFLADRGSRYPQFRLRMQGHVTGLLERSGRVCGVKADTPDGPLEIEADLVVGADGRHSVVRGAAGLHVKDLGSPIDILWLRLPRRSSDPSEALGYFDSGRVLVTIDRGDYWQCAFVIRKGQLEELRAQGIETLRNEVIRVAPLFRERMEQVRGWEDVNLLTVKVDRLRQWWRSGLVCIGDAAHAMSPVGGVGINLAVQDAVAAANILSIPLRDGRLSDEHLAALQRRRLFPTRITQAVQVLIHQRVINQVLGARQDLRMPLPLKLLEQWPWLRRFPGRAIGVGVRPEHVRLPPV